MPQITTTLPKSAWQNIIIEENNDPIVIMSPTSKLRLANENITIRKTLVAMLEKAANNLPDEFYLYIIEGVRSMEDQEKTWNESYKEIQKEFPNKDQEFREHQTNLLVAKPAPLANHNCGGAVDVQLVYKENNNFVDMGTPAKAGHGYAKTQMLSDEITNIQKQNRRILREAMEQAGFVWYPGEWWHYCYGDRMWAVYTRQERCFYGPVNETVNAHITSIIRSANV